jgi:hypothetical protein
LPVQVTGVGVLIGLTTVRSIKEVSTGTLTIAAGPVVTQTPPRAAQTPANALNSTSRGSV